MDFAWSNNMELRKFITILALAFVLPVSAEIVTVVQAVETTAGNVNVPTSVNGRLSFKPCDSACEEDYVSVRLTPETSFVVKGQPVSFLDFRRSFFNLKRDADTYALVSYNVEKNTVTTVHIGD